MAVINLLNSCTAPFRSASAVLQHYTNHLITIITIIIIITDRRDARVIGEHESADSVSRLDVWRLPGECHLDAGRTPRNELRQLALTYSLQTFMDLC